MDAIIALLAGLTVWHWLGIGIVLLTLEVAIGTFDMLWIAVAAFSTAIFAWLVGDREGAWSMHLVWFGITALALVFMGRTVFKGLRRTTTTHPNLNDRIATMIGKQGAAASAFESGVGRVKIGDTVWPAMPADGGVINEGDQVIVTGSEGTTLKVKLA